MRSSSVVVWLGLSVVAVMGCNANENANENENAASTATTKTSSTNAVDLTSVQKVALSNLERETNTKWSIEKHSRFATPTFLAPVKRGAGPAILKPLNNKTNRRDGDDGGLRATVDFLHAHKDVFRMTAPREELVKLRTDVDELNMTHVRLAQVERGVPVVGGELYAHYDAEGRVTAIQGHYVPELAALSITPTISADDARRVAIADSDALAKTSASLDYSVSRRHTAPVLLNANPKTTRLVVLAHDPNHAPALAYEIRVREIGGLGRAWIVTVDAHSGTVINRIDAIESLAGSGVGVRGDTKKLEYTEDQGALILIDKSRGAAWIRTFDLLNGSDLQKAVIVQSKTATAWDTGGAGKGSAVDAHVSMGLIYDFYKKTFNRKSWNDKDEVITNVVHDGVSPDNASYNNFDNVMRFGDGKDLFGPLAGALDVTAHEYTHAITFNTSALRYETQSGALNEAISDIFGAIVEHSVKPDPVANWQIGEGFVKDDKFIRDMITPGASKLAPQPSHMKELVNTQQDNGGVHINSGIINKAAHLMTVGGTHPVSNVTVTNPIGFDKLAQIFYRANQRYLIASSDFALAAKATMEAATDLKLAAGDLDTIDCAWKAVGVVQGDCATGAAAKPQSQTPGSDSDDPDNTTGSTPNKTNGDHADDSAKSDTPSNDDRPKNKDDGGATTGTSSGCSTATTSSSSSSSSISLAAAMMMIVSGARRRRRR